MPVNHAWVIPNRCPNDSGVYNYICIMATGNLLLGMGKKSIGDITLYRSRGKQRARARNRNPKNPRSQAQNVQRAFTATTAKAYSMFKSLADHSFQGKAVGADNQAEFLKVNMEKLRANMISDINNNTPEAECLTAVVNRNSIGCALNPYTLSKGSAIQNLITLVANGEGTPNFAFPVGTANATVNSVLGGLGIVAGDIFTIAVHNTIDAKGAYASQYGTFASCPTSEFGFVRLIVKDQISDELKWQAAKVEEIFDIESKNILGGHLATLKTSKMVTEGAATKFMLTTPSSNDIGGVAIIRSRRDSGIRSNSSFKFVNEEADTIVDYPPCGIKQMYVENAWGDSNDTLGASTLILEGGGF